MSKHAILILPSGAWIIQGGHLTKTKLIPELRHRIIGVAGDAKEAALWDDYMRAYKDAMEASSTKDSPWFIIPADKKWFTRLAVSEIIVKKLESLGMKYPVLTDAHKAELVEAKKLLEGGA